MAPPQDNDVEVIVEDTAVGHDLLLSFNTDTEHLHTDDEDEVEDAGDEVLDNLAEGALPYLKEGVSKEDAHKHFQELGVRCMADVRELKEEDLLNIMALLPLRRWIKSVKGETPKNRQSANTFSLSACVTPDQMQLLKHNNMMTLRQRRLLIQNVGSHISNNWKGEFTQKHSQLICQQLTSGFKRAFGLLDDSNKKDFKVLVFQLARSLWRHVDYLSINRRRNHSSKGRPKKKFTTYEEYALIPEEDEPRAMLTEHSKTVLLEKRDEMKEMHEDSTKFVKATVLRLMEMTFVLQRLDINKKMSAGALLDKWPFLGLEEVMERSFRRVTKMNQEINIPEREAEIVCEWLPLFKYLSHQSKRKGKDANIPEKLTAVFRDENYKKAGFFTLLRCLMIHLGIPTANLFVCFPDTASCDEIEASENLPQDGKPFLAILGEDNLPLRKAFVCVDGTVILKKQLELSPALHLLFQSYFVFKIAYAPKAAPVLEFIQRQLYDIEEPGTRTGRIVNTASGKVGHAPPAINPTYAKMVLTLADFNTRHRID